MVEKEIDAIVKSIPEKSWNRLVKTSCDVFEKSLAPIIETTSGIGRLIKAKFDRLIDEEKVLVSETFSKANQKVVNSNESPKGKHNLNIVLQVVQEACKQTDEKLRDLWSNLLANEIIEGNVHPEVINILRRLSSDDAKLLIKVAEQSPKTTHSLHLNSLIRAFGKMPNYSAIFNAKEDTFSEKHLENLGLIEKNDGQWNLTIIGYGFIDAVSDPSTKGD